MTSQNFQVNLRGVIDLLSGHLYSGPQVYIRELLQNSVDAITARDALSDEQDFRGEINFEVMGAPAGKSPTLIVSDNGVGLTEDEVHQFLATIGQSSKRDPLTRDTFLGQFGIGLLSGFMVCEEIVVITRSAKEANAATIEWRGRADGTYTVRQLDQDFEPGTQVFLNAKPGCFEFVEAGFVTQMAKHYGQFLPISVYVSADDQRARINRTGPWNQSFDSDRLQHDLLLEFGQEQFDMQFLDVIPLETESGGIRGMAFVQPFASNVAARQSHCVYLRNMLLTEQAENLLPDWAFFVRCVFNIDDLRPTASRESLQDDEQLAAARAELGAAIRRWLIDIGESDRDRLNRILHVHYLSMKGLALEDDEFYRMFIDWLPFETSLGSMTLTEIMAHDPTIRMVSSRDQFRQISGVAAAQGLCVVNSGYVYDTDLLNKLSDVFPDRVVENVELNELAQSFEDLSLDERETVFEFLKVADLALQPFRTQAEIRRFAPDNLPVLYTANDDATFLRSIEQTREKTDELWSDMLSGLSSVPATSSYSQLCFNFNNDLVRKLAGINDRELIRRSVEMLYAQALLLGHYPLKTAELRLMSDGLRGLIEYSVRASENNTDSNDDSDSSGDDD